MFGVLLLVSGAVAYQFATETRLVCFCFRTLILDTKTTQQRREGEPGDFQMLEKSLTWKGSIFQEEFKFLFSSSM